MQELPPKDFYKLSEVCQYTDTQPYVLRFWESEFPQLQPGKSASGQRLYRRKDIDVVRRIKQLLHDEEQTLDAARRMLDEEMARGSRIKPVPSARPTEVAAEIPRRASEPRSAVEQPRRRIEEPVIEPAPPAAMPPDVVSRERYENAIDEIDHLRMALKEAERNLRRAESDADEARESADRERERAESAIGHLERLHRILSD